MERTGPNAEFITCWNDILEPKFKRFQDTLVGALGAHSDRVIDAAAGPGERVIDVGCGWGDTTIRLGRRVGAGGAVLGIDCVDKFLQYGREAAAAAGLAHVHFVDADAQTHPFVPGWDLVFARFGTMFFQSPVHALRNLGRATRPGGRLAMLVWRPIEENEWLHVAKQIALAHLPPLAPPSITCGPGPFSMASQDVVAPILEAAGWRDPSWEPIDVTMSLGPVEDAIAMQMALGPAGEIIREAGERGEAKRDLIHDELTAAMQARVRDGAVRVGAASWCIRATWPS